MKNRRAFLLTVTSGLMALAVLAAPVIADELFGVITKVDVQGKKLMVMPKDQDKEIEVSVTDSTEVVGKKGATPIDLEKLEKGVKKQQDAGKKGIMARIEHEKSVASKIYVGKKKEEPKNDN